MIKIPNPDSFTVVADWIELYVATTGNTISKAKLSSLLEGSSGEEPREYFIGDIWRELNRRQKLYNSTHFTVDELAIEPAENQSPEITYIACLLISLYGPGNSSDKIAKLFERISCLAIKQYLDGEGIVFGSNKLISVFSFFLLLEKSVEIF